MNAPMGEQQLAEIRTLVHGAQPAHPGLLKSIAEAYRDRREHEHPKGNEDWFCTNLAGWMGDRMPVVLARLLDAESRVAELETVAAQARAALGALCYDLEDPGSNAYGALYLLQQATVWVDGGPDDGARALAKHDAQILRQAAEALEAADRDDDAINLLYLLASDTEKAGDPR